MVAFVFPDPAPHTTEHIATHNISHIKAKLKAYNILAKLFKDDVFETLQGCDIAHRNRVQNVSFGHLGHYVGGIDVWYDKLRTYAILVTT